VELPLSIVERAHLPRLEPAGDAVEVEGVVADTPGHGALFAGGRGLVGLAFYTWTPPTPQQLFITLQIWQQPHMRGNYTTGWRHVSREEQEHRAQYVKGTFI
jgi:hypothetical protein